MTTSKPTQGAFARPATETTQAWQHHTAKFTIHWGRSGAVIAADGEIDAVNAGAFAADLKRCCDYCEWLILDLSGVTFLGTEGFSAIQSINDQCSLTQTEFRVIPSQALETLLRVCAPQAPLPLVESLTDALAGVQRSGRPLRLVP
ncbi:STAS domain-containing protein [Mycolicibacter minnesotensis]